MDTITGIDEFTDPVPIPEDLTDLVTATSVVQGLQAVTNRTTYLENRLGGVFLVNMTGTTESGTALFLADDSEATYTDTIKIALADVTTLAGDIIEVDLTVMVKTDLASAAGFRLSQSLDAGALSEISGARADFGSLGTDLVPLTLTGVITSASAGTTHIWLQACSPGGVQEAYAYAPYVVRVRQYRGV